MPEVRISSREELPCARGQGWQPTVPGCDSTGAAERSDPTPEAKGSGWEEQPHAHGATQDGRVMMERSDRMWSTGGGNGKPLQYSCLENPMNSMKRQNDRILKEKLARSVGAQHATGDQWRNNSRNNEWMEPKQKQYPAVDVTGDRSKV